MNYEKDVNIDETALDVEWLEQPNLMLKYTRNEADALKQVDLIKEKLGYIKSELDKQIREDPEKFGIAKITETVILNTIQMQDEYKDVMEELIEAQYECNIAKGATKAVQQRKDALQSLVTLYGQNYFAGPKVPRDLSVKRREKTNAGVNSNKKLRRVKKN